MKKSAIILSLLFTSSLMAAKDGHKHHNLGAHEHGSVKLAMAIEGKSIDVELDGPAESFLGFEHKPNTVEDQQALIRASELWTKDILTKLIIFPNTLNCRLDAASFNQELEESTSSNKSGKHSEIEAMAKFTCSAGTLKGSEVKIALKDKYPKIKKLKLEIIDADKTKAFDITNAIMTIRL